MAGPTDELARLLGGIPDPGDDPAPLAGVDRALEEAPAELRRQGLDEIDALLDGRLCENQLRDALLYEIGCAYPFERDGYDASSWLRYVRRRLAESFRGDSPPRGPSSD